MDFHRSYDVRVPWMFQQRCYLPTSIRLYDLIIWQMAPIRACIAVSSYLHRCCGCRLQTHNNRQNDEFYFLVRDLTFFELSVLYAAIISLFYASSSYLLVLSSKIINSTCTQLSQFSYYLITSKYRAHLPNVHDKTKHKEDIEAFSAWKKSFKLCDTLT